MKIISCLLAVLVLTGLCAEDVRQLESRLKKSVPGAPEFRAYADMFGAVRSVRTLPGSKTGGIFKLSLLRGQARIGMLDLTGLAEVDLSGLGDHKELKTLVVGAGVVKGLQSSSHPGLLRLDISRTKIREISWMKNYPGVRELKLPETVSDISPVKGRSFRALSLPGVKNPDEVCRALGINVAIRPFRAGRRSDRQKLPPVVLKYNKNKEITEFSFKRFVPPARKNQAFIGEMFPEERNSPAYSPWGEEYPGLEKFTRNVPLEAAVFLKDSKSLQKLDLRGMTAVLFNGEEFPELRELYLSGTVIGLHTLKTPRLKKLKIENGSGWVPGENFRRRAMRYRQTVKVEARGEAVPVALRAGLDLDELEIFMYRDEFDFNSLRKIRVRKLKCACNGTSIEFLRNQKITHLSLSAPEITGGAGAVLGTLPLKHLELAAGEGLDCSFLKKLHLSFLSLSGRGENKFSLALLRRMPLEVLRLDNMYKGNADLRTMKFPKLQELILSRTAFTRIDFLRGVPGLKNLALENCVFSPAGLRTREPDLDYVCGDLISREILKLQALENLRIGRIGVFNMPNRIVNYDFPWERFKVLKLKNLSVYAERGDFAKDFKYLERLKIDDISRHGIAVNQVRAGNVLETLVLTNARPRPDAPVPDRRPLFRRPVMPDPVSEPGIAKKVYTGVPGGFNGGFLH